MSTTTPAGSHPEQDPVELARQVGQATELVRAMLATGSSRPRLSALPPLRRP